MWQKSRILLFLGAGASQFAGYRTFADFPQLLFDEKLRRSEGLPPIQPGPLRILEQIKNALESTEVPTTHDNFLWRLDAYTQLLRLNQRDPVLQDYLRSASLHDLYLLTDGAVDAMAKTTIRHYSANRVNHASAGDPEAQRRLREVYGLYCGIASECGKGVPLPVFSTNYDMLLEDLFASFSNAFRLVTGLSRGTSEGATWAAKQYETSSRKLAVHLFRLHGCCCWFYHGQGDGSIYFHRSDAAQQSREHLCAMYPGLEREKGTGPHGHGFRQLYKHLQSCDVALFVGFSFRDDDVMHVLLKACADRRERLKVLIVDKSLTAYDVKVRLDGAARRSTFLVYVPRESEISALRMAFGSERDSCDRILKECRALLRG
jgi:hypothetical protein